jgi:hypothetical protein
MVLIIKQIFCLFESCAVWASIKSSIIYWNKILKYLKYVIHPSKYKNKIKNAKNYAITLDWAESIASPQKVPFAIVFLFYYFKICVNL